MRKIRWWGVFTEQEDLNFAREALLVLAQLLLNLFISKSLWVVRRCTAFETHLDSMVELLAEGACYTSEETSSCEHSLKSAIKTPEIEGARKHG